MFKMKSSTAFLMLAAYFGMIAELTSSHFERVHGVIKLTPLNYDEVVAKHKRLIVLFYHPSCKTDHCVHVHHDYLDAAHHQINRCPSEMSKVLNNSKLTSWTLVLQTSQNFRK